MVFDFGDQWKVAIDFRWTRENKEAVALHGYYKVTNIKIKIKKLERRLEGNIQSELKCVFFFSFFLRKVFLKTWISRIMSYFILISLVGFKSKSPVATQLYLL